MSRGITVIIITIFCLNLISCTKSSLAKTIVILIDLSESTNKPETRNNYLRGLKLIIDKINHGDILIIDRILESSITQSTLPINEQLPSFVPSSDNPFFVKKERKK